MNGYQLIPHNPDNMSDSGLKAVISGNCPFSDTCQNKSCYFVQRDRYKFPPFCSVLFGNDENAKQEYYDLIKNCEKECGPIEKDMSKYWRVQLGTNCLMFYCEAYK